MRAPTRTGLLLACLLCPAAAGQEAPRRPVPDRALPAELKRFVAGLRQPAADDRAVAWIDAIVVRFPGLHPRDQAAVARTLAWPLLSARLHRPPAAPALYRAATRALGALGRRGSGYLWRAFRQTPKFRGRGWVELRGLMLEQLGRTRDPAYVPHLLKNVALTSPSPEFAACAGGALRHFRQLPLAARKEIAGKLIRSLANTHGNAYRNLDPADPTTRTAQARLQRIRDPWNRTLRALTGQDIREPGQWQRFLNKHGGHDWDRPLPRKTR